MNPTDAINAAQSAAALNDRGLMILFLALMLVGIYFGARHLLTQNRLQAEANAKMWEAALSASATYSTKMEKLIETQSGLGRETILVMRENTEATKEMANGIRMHSEIMKRVADRFERGQA